MDMHHPHWKNNEMIPPEISTEQESGADRDDRDRRSNPTDMGCITVDGRRGLIHCLTIIGQIEGHNECPSETKTTKYEHVIPQLVAIEESRDVRGLLVLLNTVGGDIEAGLALAELIAGMRTPTVSLVLGGGHSIGVPLAVSAKRSFITPSATMTIHPVRMNGLVLGVAQTMNYFEQMQERIVRFVTQNSRIPAGRYRAMMLETGELAMDFGTIVTGGQAVREGLIDEVGGLAQAVECLYGMIPEES